MPCSHRGHPSPHRSRTSSGLDGERRSCRALRGLRLPPAAWPALLPGLWCAQRVAQPTARGASATCPGSLAGRLVAESRAPSSQLAPHPGRPADKSSPARSSIFARLSALTLPSSRVSAALVLMFLAFGVILGGVIGSPVQDTLAASGARHVKLILPSAAPVASTTTPESPPLLRQANRPPRKPNRPRPRPPPRPRPSPPRALPRPRARAPARAEVLARAGVPAKRPRPRRAARARSCRRSSTCS